MECLALSHLLLAGPVSVGELGRILRVSDTYSSLVATALVNKGFALKKRVGMKIIVQPNLESPFVRDFSKFVILVGAYPPYIPSDFIKPKSKRIIIKHLRNKGANINDIKNATMYTRAVIYNALRPFLKTGMVQVSGKRNRVYRINLSSPLTEPWFNVINRIESDIDMNPVLEKISSDERVIALSVFGSQVTGRKDRLSDVDAFVVVNSPKNRGISKEYANPRLQLNVYSRKGIVQLVRKEPWFFKLISEGKILKGEEILSGLENLPPDPDYDGTINEIRNIIGGLDKLNASEKAKVMMYCIRTSLAMKLYLDEKLTQERFTDELARRYPEYDLYRSGKANGRKIRIAKEKILEELNYVEERKEKGR